MIIQRMLRQRTLRFVIGRSYAAARRDTALLPRPPLHCCGMLLLVLALNSFVIIACGGSDDDGESDIGLAAATPTTTVSPTIEAVPSPTATTVPVATSEPDPTSTMEPEPTDPTMTIEPSSGPHGTTFNVYFSDLIPREDYVVVITDPDGTAHTEEHTAGGGTYLTTRQSGSGMSAGYPFEGWIIELGEPSGEYVVELHDADGVAVLARATFTVEAPASTATSATGTAETPEASTSGVSLRISPDSGTVGSNFLFITEGLSADQAYTYVLRDPDGEELLYDAEYNATTMELVVASGPDTGMPLTIWQVQPLDPKGIYIVEIRDRETGDVLVSATFTVE